MKKSILNIGKALNKAEQKSINGGKPLWCGYCHAPDSYEMWYACGTDKGSACRSVGR